MAEKDDKIKNDHKMLLSEKELLTIKIFSKKMKTFPGPTDDEVEKAAKILLRSKLKKNDVQEMLGEPFSISKSFYGTENSDVKISIFYSIGDSRAISILFNEDEKIIYAIQGTGVGFDQIKRE